MSLDAVLKAMKGEVQPLGQCLHSDADFEPLKPAKHSTNPQRSLLNSSVHALVGTVVSAESEARNEAENYLTEFMTAVPLFVAGRRGYLASAMLFGLNEAKTGDSFNGQMADIGLGCAKGLATKCSLDVLGSQKSWSIPVKGLSMGISGRTIDAGLTRTNWLDQNGSVQPAKALESVISTSAHPLSLATDVLTFGIAHGAVGLTNRLTKGAIQASPSLVNTLTGAAFGFTSGALNETSRQLSETDESPDVMRILARGGAGAVVNGVAARVGHGINSIEQRLPELSLSSDASAKGNERQVGVEAPSAADRSSANDRATAERLIEADPLSPRASDAKIAPLSPGYSLGPYRLIDEVLKIIPPGAEKPEARSFRMRKYSLGELVLTVPDAYAAQLDAIRDRQLGGAVTMPALHSSEPYLPATADLAHYSIVVDPIRWLPDPSLVRQVRVLPFSNADDPYWRNEYKDPNFISGASANYLTGVINLYRPSTEFVVNSGVMEHEWFHLVRPLVSAERKAYGHAYTIENKENVSRYATYNPEENWAETGSKLISMTPGAIELLARIAPVRTAVACRAVAIAMAQSGNADPGLLRALNQARAMTNENALFLARTALTDGLTLEQRVAGAHLLGFLDEAGTYADVLLRAAKSSAEPEVAREAFNGLVHQAHGEWQGYGECITTNEDWHQRISHMIELAQFGSATRGLAIEALQNVYDPRAAEYLKALTIDAAPGDKIAHFFSVLDEIKDPGARRTAFEETRRLVSDDPAESLRLAHEIEAYDPNLVWSDLPWIRQTEQRMASSLRRKT